MCERCELQCALEDLHQSLTNLGCSDIDTTALPKLAGQHVTNARYTIDFKAPNDVARQLHSVLRQNSPHIFDLRPRAGALEWCWTLRGEFNDQDELYWTITVSVHRLSALGDKLEGLIKDCRQLITQLSTVG